MLLHTQAFRLRASQVIFHDPSLCVSLAMGDFFLGIAAFRAKFGQNGPEVNDAHMG